MEEVSSSLPTEPVLLYLSAPNRPGHICTRLFIPHIRIVGVGTSSPSNCFFQNFAPKQETFQTVFSPDSLSQHIHRA